MCCPLGMCVALWCKSFEKFNIKSPKAPKHGMFVFFASVSKNFASLISTIVYNIIELGFFWVKSNIFNIWFSVLIKEY